MSSAGAPDLALVPSEPSDAPIVDRVFSHWQSKCSKPKARRTPQRVAKIRARLREGYPEADLLAAIDFVAASDFHRGANDRGQRYDDLELILRDGTHVEKYRDSRTPVPTAPQRSNADILRDT